MRTINVDLFTFNELSDEAKEKAIRDNRGINVEYEDWYEHINEMFIENSAFDVTKIYFSGFWSQGDGAMFEYDSLPSSFMDSFIDQLKLSSMRKNWLKNNICVSGKGRHSGHYYHEKSCSHNIYWEVNNGDLHWATTFYQWLESFEADFEQYVIDFYENECIKLYRGLEQQYDYLTSDESITDTILCNEYEFTEDGQMQ